MNAISLSNAKNLFRVGSAFPRKKTAASLCNDHRAAHSSLLHRRAFRSLRRCEFPEKKIISIDFSITDRQLHMKKSCLLTHLYSWILIAVAEKSAGPTIDYQNIGKNELS